MNLDVITIKDSLLKLNLSQISKPKKMRILCDSHLNITHPERSKCIIKLKIILILIF